MLIKKFQANTETEAIMLAKEELGKDAIVMNIKTSTPRGFKRLFKKPTVEVTAAVDEGVLSGERTKKEQSVQPARIFRDVILEPESPAGEREEVSVKEDKSEIEKRLNNLQTMIEKQILDKPSAEANNNSSLDTSKNIACIKLVYNQLVENEVEERYVNQIIGEIENTLKKDTPLDSILAGIYQKIILKLGQPKTLELEDSKAKFVFFIGPTGVGKTTTIAKIASSLVVGRKLKVALVTSDTYRIAAVEQLRTYANILDVPLKVIYSHEEMRDAKVEFAGYDVVLVDTAGRSHKNREQRDDVEKLISVINQEEREVYLVLSVTTKYRDLIHICDTYSEIADFRLIFTKLDETNCVGNILNIRMHTGASLSYATFGQNVPDDIGKMDAQMIAKQLLGGND